MESTITTQHRNLAIFIELSVFSKYFFPLGNFIAPIVLWTLNKDRSSFIDHHGKQALNFQLSLMLYNIILIFFGIAFFLWNLDYTWDFFRLNFDNSFLFWENFHFIQDNVSFIVAFGTLFLGLWVFEIVCVVSAAQKARDLAFYKFPLTINFFK